MKRIALGIAALAAVAATAVPASAHAWFQNCYYETFPYPCGVCVHEGPVYRCTR